MSNKSLEEEILGRKHFAVLGASRDKDKYGYKVYRKIKAAGYTVYAINPNADEIDGDPCYPSLDNTPEPIDCLVTVTPPEVTEARCIWRGACEFPLSGCSPARNRTPLITPRKAPEYKPFPAGRASCRKSRREKAESRDRRKRKVYPLAHFTQSRKDKYNLMQLPRSQRKTHSSGTSRKASVFYGRRFSLCVFVSLCDRFILVLCVFLL